jgi:cardiolipin synthase (CMP-forming)
LIRLLPNLISLARLALVPVVLRAIWLREYEWALAWCAVAGISDGLDGFLARRLRATSRFGAYLDPVADKLLLSGAYLTLGLDGVIPWWLTAVVFGRDALMLLAIGWAMRFTKLRDFEPTVWGKVSTAIQILTALVVLVDRTGFFGEFPRVLEKPMILLTVVGTAWSAIHYTLRGMRMLESAR